MSNKIKKDKTPKRILMVGQSGLEKSKYLEELQTILERQGYSLSFDTIGHKMIEIYNRHGRSVTEDTILNLERDSLELLERQAWREIIESIDSVNTDFYVINTHVVFRWDHGLIPVIDVDLLLDYKPEIIVCLIDDIINVQHNLLKRGIYKFNLWELFVWREEEIWFGKFMSDFLRKFGINTSFYILPKRQGATLFSQILLTPNLPKAYLSFPITGAPESVKEEIKRFKEAIASTIIAFDPYSIRDREITFSYYTQEEEIKEKLKEKIDLLKENAKIIGGDSWEIYIDDDTVLTLIKFKNLDRIGFPEVELLGREHLMTIRAIDAQIIARDYLLIDQSDFIVVYIGTDEKGSPRISAGCQSEITYAYKHGKEVNVIFKGGERRLSPWITQFSNVFKTIDDCLKYIQERYIQRGGR